MLAAARKRLGFRPSVHRVPCPRGPVTRASQDRETRGDVPSAAPLPAPGQALVPGGPRLAWGSARRSGFCELCGHSRSSPEAWRQGPRRGGAGARPVPASPRHACRSGLLVSFLTLATTSGRDHTPVLRQDGARDVVAEEPLPCRRRVPDLLASGRLLPGAELQLRTKGPGQPWGHPSPAQVWNIL